ncbi:M20 family metallopeptidase [bacterium]|nr:M20 family metallopeptidase [bacterium]
MQIPTKLNSLFPSELQSRLLALRRSLHQHPELSLQEEKTATRLYDELALLKPVQLDRVAGTGVVARIKGQDSSAATVSIRGDIDALPIHEQTGLEYASVNEGIMHACGHDVHATWTVGAAHLLSQQPAQGDVIIVLQPAEEVAKGAQAILDSGVLDRVSAIFGGHVDRRYQVGEVVAQDGTLAASSDFFEIDLTGKGAHGARPHESRDPIVGLAGVISAVQTIVSRRLNPANPAVISFGTVNAGTAENVIPETARLTGTVRALDAETRAFLHAELKKTAESTAAAYELGAEVKIELGTPPIINPKKPAFWAQNAVRSLLGDEGLVPLAFLNMGGEDFAAYMEKISGCFMRIGAREPDGDFIPAHSSDFYAADDSIFVGAAVLAETARIASAELSG